MVDKYGCTPQQQSQQRKNCVMLIWNAYCSFKHLLAFRYYYSGWNTNSINGVFQSLDSTYDENQDRTLPSLSAAPPFQSQLLSYLTREYNYPCPILNSSVHRDIGCLNLIRTHTVHVHHLTHSWSCCRMYSTSLSPLFAPQRGVHGMGLDKEEDPSVLEQAVTIQKQKKKEKVSKISGCMLW